MDESNKPTQEDAFLQFAKMLGITTNAGIEALRVALENVELLEKKHKDYGPKNITDFGLLGIVVRMNDKFRRLEHLFGNRKRKAINESIRDTLRDIANYATIALIVDMGKWPKE